MPGTYQISLMKIFVAPLAYFLLRLYLSTVVVRPLHEDALVQFLAQLSRAAIIPVYISVDRAWTARSWDRFLIPRPFSQVRVRFGEPIDVPEQMDEGAFEALRLAVEKKMIQGHALDDRHCGWERPL